MITVLKRLIFNYYFDYSIFGMEIFIERASLRA